MSFIEEIDPADAEGRLADIYAEISGARGGVAGVMSCHSLHPEAMLAHFEFYKTLMFKRSPLTRRQRELIGVVVSAANTCSYCVAHHTEPLRAYKVPERELEALGRGELPETLDEPTLALARFARALTVQPQAEPRAIEALREAGFDDRAVLDATLITGYFNFVNRVVIGLGVAIEPDFEASCKPDLG
jgi:uncharacterized peroxidase-related enzyme